jgi:MYXO-CTERM domain-containing protein
MKRLTCALAMALLCGYGSAAVATPVVGSPVALDTPVVSSAGGAQNRPAVAFDGTNYLVVWNDYRDLGQGALYGARVDKTGKVLDPTGFRIMDGAGSPSLAFGGGEYLVVLPTIDGYLYARLDGSGKLIDSVPLRLAQTEVSSVIPPGIAWNGSEFFVVWEDRRANQADVYGARISKAGTLLDPTGIGISTAKGNHRSPRVASDGSGFFVIWMDERVVLSQPRAFGARVSSDGAVLDPDGIYLAPITDHQQFYPTICFDGTNYQIAWEDVDYTEPSKAGMRGVLLSPAGTTVVGDIILSSTSTDSSLASACSSSGSLVAWRGGTTRVDTSGRVLDPTGLLVPPQTIYATSPAVASDGTNYLLVWQDASGGSFLVETTVSASGSVGDRNGTKLIKSANTQTQPAIVRGASGYLAVFFDDRASGSGVVDLYGMPLDDSGKPAAAASLIRSWARPPSGIGQPGLAWNGSHYFVAWLDMWNGPTMQMYRLDGTGKPLGQVQLPAGAVVAANSWSTVGVTSDGSNFLVAWTDSRNTPPRTPGPGPQPTTDLDIYATRIGDDGTILDAQSIQVAGGTAQQSTPAAAFDGTNFLVTWLDDYSVRAARVDRSGVLLDSTSIPVGGKATGSLPAIAWGQGTYLIAWLGASGPTGMRLDPSGKLLDASAFPITNDPVSGIFRSLSASWDGQSFLVAWAGSNITNGFALGARVGADGTRPDANGFFIETPVAGETAGQTGYPSQVGLASDGKGHWVSLTDRYDPSPGIEVVRARAHLITDCTGSQCPSPPDGGVIVVADAGVADAGAADALRPDAKLVDGPVDPATRDGGADAGVEVRIPSDAGSLRDGTDTSGDAGTSSDGIGMLADAGTPRDGTGSANDTSGPAPSADASSTGANDASANPAAKVGSKGCSCHVGDQAGKQSQAWLWALLPVGLAIARARRRR